MVANYDNKDTYAKNAFTESRRWTAELKRNVKIMFLQFSSLIFIQTCLYF